MGRKYAVLNNMCYAEFLRYYHLKEHSASNETQPKVLTEKVSASNLSSSFLYPKFVTLMKSEDKLHCRNIPFVLRYHVRNKHIYPEIYSHHLLFLFYPFQSESELVCDIDRTHTSKLFELGF